MLTCRKCKKPFEKTMCGQIKCPFCLRVEKLLREEDPKRMTKARKQFLGIK